MDIEKFEHFRDWIPARGYWKGERAFIDWCFMDKKRLTEPFFDDSIMKRFREPFNLLFRHQTPIEFLGELHEFCRGTEPTGFVFHLSRCGSTLVSQMLAALPQNIVISEASPIDFVLRSGKMPPEGRAEWLRWTLNAFGQQRTGLESRLFIKFDSWNTLEINLIKRAFPAVPWIFLYRDPVEIIVSHMRQRGAHMIPGTIGEILPDVGFEESVRMPPEEFCARVLGKICQSALEPLKRGEGLAVNYTELPRCFEQRILKHFKFDPDSADLAEMLAASELNAKNPVMNFSPDTERKKREASPAARAAAEKFVNPFYEELEKIRNNTETERL